MSQSSSRNADYFAARMQAHFELERVFFEKMTNEQRIAYFAAQKSE